MNPTEELRGISDIWPEAQLRADGGNPAIFLPQFHFESGGAAVTMDLLLYPQSHGGYVTRLFFRSRLSRGPNWKAHFVCGETWWAPSWQSVSANQPWMSILAGHLKAVS